MNKAFFSVDYNFSSNHNTDNTRPLRLQDPYINTRLVALSNVIQNIIETAYMYTLGLEKFIASRGGRISFVVLIYLIYLIIIIKRLPIIHKKIVIWGILWHQVFLFLCSGL